MINSKVMQPQEAQDPRGLQTPANEQEMSTRFGGLIKSLIMTHEDLCVSMSNITGNRPMPLNPDEPSCHKHALDILEDMVNDIATLTVILKRELK